MPITIVATAGSASANSYVTEAEALAYFTTRLGSTAYLDGDAETQKAALVSGTKRLDQEMFAGQRATDTQALKWPRDNAYDPDHMLYADTVVPQCIKDAACEVALAALQDVQALGGNALDQFAALTVGPIALTLRDGTKMSNKLPAAAQRLVSHLLGSGNGLISVVRG